MNQKIKVIVFLVLVILPVTAAIPKMSIDVFIFHTETCPACSRMMEFLNEALQDYPTLVIYKFDIRDEENKKLYDLFKEVHQLDVEGYPVPMVFIGKDSFAGYTATNLKLIDKKLEGCLREGCTITLTQDRETVVIIDSTPTPELFIAEFLLPLLVLAGVFCCLNPFNSEVVLKLKMRSSFLFFSAYFVTSLLLCFALVNVISILDSVIFLRVPLVVIAVLLGILSVISAKREVLKVPQSFKNAMDQLAADQNGFNLFSLGIGACIISLVYTLGIYLLVVYRMLFFTFTDRLQNLLIFNVSLLVVLILLYAVKSERKGLFSLIVGAGSIVLGIIFWMVW